MSAETDYQRDEDDYFDPTDSGTEDAPSSAQPFLLDAPDFTQFVKRTRTARGKEYEQKLASMGKAGFYFALHNGMYPDAAAILEKGPSAAEKLGDLAAQDERIARGIDMLTAPDNPYFAAGVAVIGLLGQLWRNHEPEIQQLPAMMKESRAERKVRKSAEKDTPKRGIRVTLPFIKRTVTLGVKLKFPIVGRMGKAVRMNTQEPQVIVNRVFSDPKLLRELKKQGIVIGHGSPNGQA